MVEARMPREGFKSRMRLKAPKLWGLPVRLTASRVHETRCRELALVVSSSDLSVVASNARRLLEVGVWVKFVLVLSPGVLLLCRHG